MLGRGRPHRVGGLAVVAALLVPAAAGAASFPPRLGFHTLEGERVSLHYHDGLEDLARRALGVAEPALADLEARYGVRVPRVHVVLGDVDDAPNGSASPLPYPLVRVRAAAPGGADGFGNHESWLRLVLVHELAHVVHLEQARGVPGFGRRLLGRAPFLFPNALSPSWLIEGLATYEETEATSFGRGRDPDARMLRRMAALEGRFPGEDRGTLGLDAWPGGRVPYVFGEAFLRDLGQRQAAPLLPEVARVHAGRLVPFLDELTARRVTGASFHSHWDDWRRRSAEQAREFARELGQRGLTPSRALTRRGIRQASPRWSPDGRAIAYASASLDRYPEIRLVAADGSGDRRLVGRNGGAGLAWTPDGRCVVYAEPEVFERFERRSDLRRVELASGRVTRLTRGLRASQPDVSRQGGRIVFVRREAEHSELSVIGLHGGAAWDLTRSAAGTEWSGPRWSPDGRYVVAARLLPGGWLDLVRVEVGSGALLELTHDRAKDVEPAFTPDGRAVVFRSDRDGVSNLYRVGIGGGALLRVTRVVGGAFTPDVSPDGAEVAFAVYSSRGFDVHVARLDAEALEPAEPFVDPYPPAHPAPAPSQVEARRYRPWPALLPRFWTPWLDRVAGEWRVGAASAGADPLLRHVWGVEAHRGADTGAFGTQGFYQYDRFAPTLLLTFEDDTRPVAGGELRDRSVAVRATLPLIRRVRSSHEVSLAVRRERETGPRGGVDLGGVELAYAVRSDRSFPMSISASQGGRVRAAVAWETTGLGSDVSLAKLSVEARAYRRLLGARDVVAVRAGAGTTLGEPGFERSFAAGGFPANSLLDLVDTNPALLRGHPDDALRGRHILHGGVEYRFPLGHPQAGWASAPLFVRHLHAAVFVDAANVWSDRFRWDRTRAGVGASLGTDVVLGHGLPATLGVGFARGLGAAGESQVFVRLTASLP